MIKQLEPKPIEYKNKRVFIIETGEIVSAPYPIGQTLIARNKAILVLEDNDAEDTA
jgi:hypothetical protein